MHLGLVLFQCGLLIGIFGGGYLYNSISNIKKGLVLTLLLMSTGAAVALVIVGVHVTNSAAMLVFRGGLVVIFATGVGLAYYIPIGIFVVKIGKEDTATVSALMDIVGYAFGSLFFVAVLTPMVELKLDLGMEFLCWCIIFKCHFSKWIFKYVI